MLRLSRAFVVLAVLALPISAAPPDIPDWPFDVLRLRNGVVHKGMFLEENDTEVRFLVVGQAPGKATLRVRLAFHITDVAKIEKLSDEDRETLKKKLDAIDSATEAEKLEKLNHRRKPRIATRPGSAAIEKRLDEKRKLSERKTARRQTDDD